MVLASAQFPVKNPRARVDTASGQTRRTFRGKGGCVSAIIDQHKQAFQADPSNLQAFTSLEEHFFMSGIWEKLAALYEQRLGAPELANDAGKAIPVLFRLAQVFEERCLKPDRAIETYWKVAKLDPTNRPALRQLRQIYSQREQWDLVLQVSEMEGQLEMSPHERAEFLAELGNIWNGKLNDPTEALAHYAGALEIISTHQVALSGLARVHESLGHHEQAAAAWERLSTRLRGPDRAPVLVSLGLILANHLGQLDRAIGCFQQALRDDARYAKAVAALFATAIQLENWPLVAEMCDRRFDVASGARKRTEVAVDAGLMNLEKLDDTQAARMWFDRALELSPDDVAVFEGIAELERRTGNLGALGRALDRVIELSGDDIATSVLLESADLYSESGREEAAARLLRRAQKRAPDDIIIAETLSDSLSKLGCTEELVVVLERRAALTEDDSQAESEIRAEIGRLYLEDLDDAESAIESLARAFELDPSIEGAASSLETLYTKNESWTQLQALLERAATDGPPNNRAHAYATLGELREQRLDNNDGAVEAYEAALAIDSACITAHQGIARIVHASGNQDDFLRICEREAETTADRARLSELVTAMLPLLEDAGRGEDALRWIEKLNDLVPDQLETLQTMIRLREELGRDDELLEPLERLDRILSGSEQTATRLRLAKLHREGGRAPEAAEWYQASLENDPNHVEALVSLKALYTETREFEALAGTMRRLAEALPPAQRSSEESELACLLIDQLGDLEGAISVLSRLAAIPAGERPSDVDERLAALLERAGRFEELAQQLHARRQGLDDSCNDQVAEARRLDTKRAQILLRDLRRFEEAASLYRKLYAADHEDPVAREGLEQALRSGNDTEGLVELLEEIAGRETDASENAKIELERATLLEQTLGAFDEARDLLTRLANECQAEDMAAKADVQLEQLLNRCGDWDALRERLSLRLGKGDDAADLELHEELARLCRDRLADREGCIEHLEAAGKLAPERHAIWQNLSILYSDLDRHEDLLRVVEQELTLPLDVERETTLRARAARLSAELPGRASSCSGHYERLLELEPGHTEASEFLLDFYDREGNPERVVELLRDRLEAAVAANATNDLEGSSSLSLRLRIAAIESDSLENPEAAVAVLAPAIEEVGPVATVARPLADLYLRIGLREDFVALARRAASQSDAPLERANWMLEVGDTLREDSKPELAVDAYREVLDVCPDNLDAQSALRELYRELERAAPLGDLLRLECDRRSGEAAVPVLLELACLLADPLAQQVEALATFDQILAIDPDHPQAYVSALDLTRKLDRHAQTRALLDRGLANTETSAARAALLGQLADLTAGPLDDAETALGFYREAFALDPSLSGAREQAVSILTRLNRWDEVLDCLFLEFQQTSAEGQAAIIERAIDIAMRDVSRDAALPWLDRLLALRPDDASVHARIAEIHRQAGRPEALLSTLESQLQLLSDANERHKLHCDIAGVLERDLSSPSRAALALEAAHAIDSGNGPEAEAKRTNLLADLDRIYEGLGRHADRVRVIEERIACPGTDANALASLHENAASLLHTRLCSSESATRHFLYSIERVGAQSDAALPLLRQLQETLKSTSRLEAWARAAEAELALLNVGRNAGDDDRRHTLRSELATCYSRHLARPLLCRTHLLALIDDWSGAEPLSSERIDAAESALLDHLRGERNHVELAKRLATRVSRVDATAAEWLELAALEATRLHRPSAAQRAYREVLQLDAGNIEAIRGLRTSTEVLQDWDGTAETFDRELALDLATNEERCDLLRRLGDIAWHKLQGHDALDRAVNAFCAILEITPGDLDSIHALQQIEEQRAGYTEVMARFEQEVKLLGEGDPERRQFAWLRIAELSRDKQDDTQRAIQAYENAAEACDLELPRTREWAELYRTAENWDRFAEVFGRWCDAPLSPANCADLLCLSQVLEDLGRKDDALERAEAATRKDARRADAWERAASLRELRGDASEATAHWAEAAELRDAETASQHLLHAAQLVEQQEPERAAKLLNRGADHDSNCQKIQARLAIVCERLEQWSEASTAAARAVYLNTESSTVDTQFLVTATLAGGRAAWQNDALELSTQLFRSAREFDHRNVEAADALGELLYLAGDLREASVVLRARLEMSEENSTRARHRAIIGEAFELDQQYTKALDEFNRAIEVDANLDQAHEGVVRIHELRDEPVEAIAALIAWTQVQQDDAMRSAQLLRAANLEQSIEETEPALTHLREATAADANNTSAWTMLAELHLKLDQPDEAVEASTGGLATASDNDNRNISRLAFVRASALVQGGEESKALEDFALAVANDPTHCEAALAQAKLQTASGGWQLAADNLGEFIENHPEPARETLCRVLYERGQLLAGPLEEVEDAIRCYERAIAIDPDFTQAIAPLANLLSYLPERWEDAAKRHGALLAEDPARESSIRSLLRICDSRGDVVSQKNGLTILRALGKASPEEVEAASTQIGFEVANRGELSDPHWESVRRMISQVADEIGESLSSEIAACGDGLADAPVHAPEREFWNLQRAAQTELSAGGFDVLPTDLLGRVATHVASLALDSEPSEIDENVAQQLERTIGRWTRRKLRKTLEGTQSDDVGAISWDAWRVALQELAALAALDRTQGELRNALITLSASPEDKNADPLAENVDISDRVRGSDAARSLLGNVARVWVSQIGRR